MVWDLVWLNHYYSVFGLGKGSLEFLVQFPMGQMKYPGDTHGGPFKTHRDKYPSPISHSIISVPMGKFTPEAKSSVGCDSRTKRGTLTI